jgi:tight adherence protein C
MLAGNPGGLEVADFLGIKGLAALVLGSLVTIFAMGLVGAVAGVLCGLVAATLGYILPSFWLRSRISGRTKEITKAMPDALDLLVISVEAGLGFDAAMQKVADKWDNHLTREFGRALSEMRVGASRRDALRGIVERTDAKDVATFIGAIIQADQLGVSVGRVLHVQADQMRMRRRQRAEEMAHKAPIKMLFPMILLIFPAMYIVILGPAIPQIIKGLGMT